MSNKEYYIKNKERILAKHKLYREQHGDLRREIENRSLLSGKKKHPIMKLVSVARYRAKRGGMEFDLDREWAITKGTGVCELSGIPYKTNFGGSMFGPFSPSIDRIDNSKGYLKSNCRIILMCINAFKHTMTEEEMINITEAMLSMRNKNHLTADEEDAMVVSSSSQLPTNELPCQTF